MIQMKLRMKYFWIILSHLTMFLYKKLWSKRTKICSRSFQLLGEASDCGWITIIPSVSGEKWKWKSSSRVQLLATAWTIQSIELLRQNTAVGSISLLQGIFPTQGSNPSLPHAGGFFNQMSHQGIQRTLMMMPHICHYPKGLFSFQSQRKAMPRNAQTTAQLHSSHTLVK